MPNNTSEQLKIDRDSKKQLSTVQDLKRRNEESLSDFIFRLTNDRINDEYEKRRRADESESEYQRRLDEKRAKEDEERDRRRLQKLHDGLGSVTSTLTSAIDSSLNTYLDAQQKLAAHLSGSSTTSLTSILDRMQSTLSTTNIVRQENVFNNLGNLVRSGITYNVEQRAFLQTLAQDIDMVFNAQDGSLTQLIRLQNRDLSSNRMAIEYSLQKFLNQNYQTSEYIKGAFSDVSRSLMTAQSTMSSRNAVDFEGTVQTWLGSMYSAGMNSNTVTNLAAALNALGSGDISNLGSGISNLVLMGAARAGLDYGALLNSGLDANTTDKLLASITSYMQEMGANQSNVVRSQLGNLFGVNITDIIAANNMRSTRGSVSSDIGTLLGDYNNFITFGTGLQNTIANLMWSFGTNIASNQSTLMGYEITNMISKSGLGDILFDVGDTLSKGGLLGKAAGTALQLAGIAATNAPLIPIIMSLFGENGTISDILSSASMSGAQAIFNALGSGSLNGSDVRFSGAGVSGSMYVSNTGINELLSGSKNSLTDLTGSMVTIEADEGPTLEENVVTITETLTSIFDLLTERLESIDENVFSIMGNSGSASVTSWSSVTRGASF